MGAEWRELGVGKAKGEPNLKLQHIIDISTVVVRLGLPVAP